MLLILILFVHGALSEVTHSNFTRGVKLEKRVFKYETVKGLKEDRMAEYVNSELRVRMLAANKDPARLVVSFERRVLAEAAIEPLLPSPAPARSAALRYATAGQYGGPNDVEHKQSERRLFNIQKMFAYRAKDRLKVLDEIISRNLKSLRFRMSFAFAKLDQLRFQMRLIYSKYRQMLNTVSLTDSIKWYTLVLKKYIDIVYMVERIYKVYNVYAKYKSQFVKDTPVIPQGPIDDRATEGRGDPNTPPPPRPAKPPM